MSSRSSSSAGFSWGRFCRNEDVAFVGWGTWISGSCPIRLDYIERITSGTVQSDHQPPNHHRTLLLSFVSSPADLPSPPEHETSGENGEDRAWTEPRLASETSFPAMCLCWSIRSNLSPGAGEP
ncbi:hypothetical protein GALMADRAFT_1086136 [Galerina marginata CBS 339.88]|uniref:Uncharacterized protein n=1 Tax=Galerina marginata (strain CBS 339.88) TaxID=685588 RepID=A0A067S998_GALM3|nr:hypothetical protein GALMADRAFT_1086136 [Galerina marginata CBS 339.88]